MALLFALSTPNLRKSVLCLTSNVSENWRIDFIELGLFVESDWLGII